MTGSTHTKVWKQRITRCIRGTQRRSITWKYSANIFFEERIWGRITWSLFEESEAKSHRITGFQGFNLNVIRNHKGIRQVTRSICVLWSLRMQYNLEGKRMVREKQEKYSCSNPGKSRERWTREEEAGGEKWMDISLIFKVESIVLSDGFDRARRQ